PLRFRVSPDVLPSRLPVFETVFLCMMAWRGCSPGDDLPITSFGRSVARTEIHCETVLHKPKFGPIGLLDYSVTDLASAVAAAVAAGLLLIGLIIAHQQPRHLRDQMKEDTYLEYSKRYNEI